MCTVTESLTDAYARCRTQLIEAGLIIPLGADGVYAFNGAFEDVVERFDNLVSRRCGYLKAEKMRFSGLLSRENYLKTSHIQNFPDLMGSVHSFTGGERDHFRMLNKLEAGDDWTSSLSPSEVMLTPAVCYPLYPTATGVLKSEGRLFDLRAFAYRHEPSIDPARMQHFRQREFVRLGTAEQAVEHRDFWIILGKEILNSVGLNIEVIPANDPFFGRGGQVMASSQLEQSLKFELIHPVATAEKPTAITSCNCHMDYFGKAFDITLSDGSPAHSACIGFGLERIALALFMTHGFDPDKWPSEVRNTLGL